ncbi:MAG: hypothetical protein FJW34_17070 [Acidobacteria bacterium]|nr:hypothetical protein [Acidobacteriota bacterium]
MPTDRRDFLQSVAAGWLARTPAAAAQLGQPVVCRVVDARSGREVPARVRLVDAEGKEAVPLGHPEELDKDAQEGDVRFQSRRYCYVGGIFRVSAARLPLRYQVLKGYEYEIAEGEISPEKLRDGAFTIPLKRWSNVSERGWYSGDIHIHHIAPKTCRLEMEAEDLNVANILTSDFTNDQDQFEGRVNTHSGGRHLVYVSQEFRNNQLGHLNLLNLQKLIEPVKPMRHEHFPLLLEVCDQARAQGGYVAWSHFPSWPGVESPLDVALEKLDGLEILCVLEPREMPIFMKEVVPEAAANDGLRQWYRYLNCGFRLTATAGTDKMTTFVTVGANRVFARLDGEFTYQNWIGALKAGRTFITNSPILSLTVNGQEPGAALHLDSTRGKALDIAARAESQLPYHRLEIVCNGQVIGQAAPRGPRHRAYIRLEYPLTQSCWIAARALEDIQPYRARGLPFSKVHLDQGTLLSDYFGTRRPETVFAHSSPVYVIRDGAPIRSWGDAQYYVRYLDACIRWLKTEARFVKAGDREASVEAFLRGRAIYEQRAREGRARG